MDTRHRPSSLLRAQQPLTVKETILDSRWHLLHHAWAVREPCYK